MTASGEDMRTIMNLTPQKVGDLSPGALFRINMGTGSALAILLSPDMDGDPIYGIVSSPDFETPLTWYEGSSTDRCLSYGSDWIFEERPGLETAPGCDLQGRTSPAAFYDGDGLVLRFSTPRGFAHQGFLFNLSASQSARQPSASRTAPLACWAIWANIEHFRRPQGEPLFEYPVTKQA
jgi:hypothetical protein